MSLDKDESDQDKSPQKRHRRQLKFNIIEARPSVIDPHVTTHLSGRNRERFEINNLHKLVIPSKQVSPSKTTISTFSPYAASPKLIYLDINSATPITNTPLSPQDLMAKHSNSKISLIVRYIGLVFFPAGYPHSVHLTYMVTFPYRFFHISIAEVSFVLATQSYLTSLSEATQTGLPLAVLFTLPDALGSLFEVMVSGILGNNIDYFPNSFKIIASICYAIGIIAMALTSFVNPFAWLPLAILAELFRYAVYSVIWYSSRAVFFQYSTINNNYGIFCLKSS